MTVILVCNTIREARILPTKSASVALPHKKCSDDFLSKSLIALIATVDSAQVGLAFGLLLFLRSLFHGLFLRGLLRHNFLGDLFDLLHALFGGLFGNMSRFGHHVGHLLKPWLFVFHSALLE